MADPAHMKIPGPVFLNGRLVPPDDAQMPVLYPGVMNGIGFYETFRTKGGHPHLWTYHRARLEQACARVAIELPPESLLHRPDRLREVIQQMLRDAAVSDAVFRYTVQAGGSDPDRTAVTQGTELLTMRPIPPTPPADGVCLHVLNSPRDSGEWVPRPKSINQLNAQLGLRELHHRAAAPEDEGLFLSREGFVVETTRQNIAWIRDAELCYPEASIGPIAGTGLAWVLDRAIPAKPCRARIDVLAKSEAVVVMNSVRGVTPVREIRDGSGRVLVTGLLSHANPLVVSLRRQWAEALAATAQAA